LSKNKKPLREARDWLRTRFWPITCKLATVLERVQNATSGRKQQQQQQQKKADGLGNRAAFVMKGEKTKPTRTMAASSRRGRH